MRSAAAIVMVGVAISSCTIGSGTTQHRPGTPSRTAEQRFVAIGASETVGVGARNPVRDSWPALLWRESLANGTVYYNLGIPGATLKDALAYELDVAQGIHPTIATVWLNVNDLLRGVPVATYRRQLFALLSGLRAWGADVLVANTPVLVSLPAYKRCLAGDQRRSCPPHGVPDVQHVEALTTKYNDAIRDVAARTGAIVVDLYGLGNIPVEDPNWVSHDGFHPSSAGYRHIADVFARSFDDS
jgi:lysophospholipase L1-like esterase